MGNGDKQGGVLVMVGKDIDIQLQNPLTMLKTIIKDWFVKQSLPAAVAAVTSFGLIVGGVSGYYLSTDIPLKINSKSPIGPIFTGGGRLLQARDGAVLIGAHSGLSCIMERLRGKEDIQSSLVAGFGGEVGIPSQATTSASSSLTTIPDIGSSSQASTSTSSSQMTIPEIGNTSEASTSTAPRLSENQRSTIKLAVMMSIFVASGVLMSEVPKLVDKII